MTSFDISKLVESKHQHVKTSIERLMKKGVIQEYALRTLKTETGQSRLSQ